jgi:hypothetical protein
MFLALIIGTIEAQAKAWRGIVPLKSTRAHVERLLGKPGEHGRYQFDNERAYIEYAGTGPCAKVNRCLCEVPEDTVISIYVELEIEMRFSELKLDKKHYTKFISRQDPTIATYSNEKIGIIYTVDQKDDDVTAIEYLPMAKDCQELLRGAKRSRLKKLRSVALRSTLSLLVHKPNPTTSPLNRRTLHQFKISEETCRSCSTIRGYYGL